MGAKGLSLVMLEVGQKRNVQKVRVHLILDKSNGKLNWTKALVENDWCRYDTFKIENWGEKTIN